MTSTQTAEKAADATREPLPAEVVGHEALYNAFRGLLRVTKAVIRDVEKNSADHHRDMEALREAVQIGHDLLFPPPLPEFPDNATVIYAHAVNAGDQLYLRSEWVTVLGKEAGVAQDTVRFLFAPTFPRCEVGLMEPLPVIRNTTPKAEEPTL